MPCASRRKVPGCVPALRIEVSRAAWSTDVSVLARKLSRCGAGTRAKSTYCDLFLYFGPALFEIWWPDIYLGGVYGPVEDKMYWPELARRSEKCAGPVLRAGPEWYNFNSTDLQMCYQILCAHYVFCVSLPRRTFFIVNTAFSMASSVDFYSSFHNIFKSYCCRVTEDRPGVCWQLWQIIKFVLG